MERPAPAKYEKEKRAKKIEFLLHKKQLFCFEAIACYVPVLGRRWYSVWIYTFILFFPPAAQVNTFTPSIDIDKVLIS